MVFQKNLKKIKKIKTLLGVQQLTPFAAARNYTDTTGFYQCLKVTV